MAKTGGSCGISGVGFVTVKDGGDSCGSSGTMGGGSKIAGGGDENEDGSCGVVTIGTSGGGIVRSGGFVLEKEGGDSNGSAGKSDKGGGITSGGN